VLDLSTLVRYSGLPNNAGLEMYPVAKKRTESNVVILIQTENGTRQTGTFLPSGMETY
jgi:tether containing UBX domain for GLUT4